MPSIAFLAFYPLSPDRIGGMDRFFWRLDEYARQSGWQITWLFPEGGDHSHYIERGFDIVPLPAGTFLEAATAYLAGRRGLDLLVSVFVEYATRYAVRWKLGGVRRYLALDHMSRRAASRARGAHWKEIARGSMAYPFVDGVVAICSFVQRDILDRLGRRWDRKVFTVTNGVDGKIFYPAETRNGEQRAKLHIAVIAHLIEEKGIQVLLRALHLARPELRDALVSIAGSGPYENSLRSLAKELGLEEQVKFLGSTNRQAELLRTADVSLVPSLWIEAFPFSVLESMACGVPVIASRVGGIPEMVGKDAAILVAPGAGEELAESLIRVGRDLSLRRRMGQSGLQRTREIYTVDHMVGGYVSVMRHMLADSGQNGHQ